MAFVMGFGGMRAHNGKLIFNPFLPNNWKSYAFRIDFREAHLSLEMKNEGLIITNYSAKDVQLVVWGKELIVKGNNTIKISK